MKIPFNSNETNEFTVFFGKTNLVFRKKEEYQFSLSYSSIDNDVNRLFYNKSQISILSNFRNSLFEKRMHLHEKPVKHFIKSISSSVFYLSCIELIPIAKRQDFEKRITIDAVLELKTRKLITKYVNFFRRNLESSEVLRVDKLLNRLITDNQVLKYPDETLAKKIILFRNSTLQYETIWKNFRNSIKVEKFHPLMGFFLLILVCLGPAILTFYKYEEKFWPGVIVFSFMAIIVYSILVWISQVYDNGGISFIIFSDITVYLLGGWLAILPLSNDLWTLNSLINPGRLTPYLIFLLSVIFIILVNHNRLKKYEFGVTFSYTLKSLFFQSLLTLPFSILIGCILLQFSFPKIVHDPVFYTCNEGNINIVAGIVNCKTEKLPNLDNRKIKSLETTDLFTASLTEFNIIVSNLPEYRINRELKDSLSSNFMSGDSLKLSKFVSLVNMKLSKDSNLVLHDLLKEYEKSESSSILPSLTIWQLTKSTSLYIFPRLLIAGSMIAYLVGFVLQLAVSSPE